ncbi:MAG: metalloregulator ArsR/SmtB family transcription factor [Candidatus Zixiibacteriota bacterium]
MTKCDDFFKALSDETRQSILKMLEQREMCVCEIVGAFDVSQPTISHHLDILKRAGLIESKRKGQNIYYSLNKDWFKECCCDFLSMFECCLDMVKTDRIPEKATEKKQAVKGTSRVRADQKQH